MELHRGSSGPLSLLLLLLLLLLLPSWGQSLALREAEDARGSAGPLSFLLLLLLLPSSGQSLALREAEDARGSAGPLSFLLLLLLPSSGQALALREAEDARGSAGPLSFLLLLLLPSSGQSLALREAEDARGSAGPVLCGEYSNQVLPDGRCRVVATLPPGDERRCPDVFRCSEAVSRWRREDQERKEQVLELRERIARLQEELWDQRQRIKALEGQQREEASGRNRSLLQRVQELEQHSRESGTLQHIQATLLYDIQAQINNISALAEWAWKNPGCRNAGHMRVQGEMRHPEIQHGWNCPVDCASVYYNGLRRSGIYNILPSVHGIPIEVLCEMETEGGGWTVIQRRQDGSVDFNRSWNEYKEGFGDLNGEFWLGNDNIHRMTSQAEYSLRIDLEDWNNKHKHAFYQVFSIEDEENSYRLHVDGFSGTAEDSFAWYHDKRSFSTPDSGNICAEISHGGWWYHQCFFSNLNGVYYKGGRYSIKNRKMLGPDGIVWYSWKDTDYYSLRKVVMMIRPRTFRPHFSP